MSFLAMEPTHEVAVVEIGFYVPGEIADLCRLVRPRIGIITAIPERPVHFSRTPSVDAIAAGKAELIEALPEDGFALLNADDARVRALASRTRAHIVLFGEAADATLRATDVRASGVEGVRFVAHLGGESAEIRLPIPGRHLVPAALAAAAREAHSVADGAEALLLLRRVLRRGDTVLVKGSRALELDRLADALARPAAAA